MPLKGIPNRIHPELLYILAKLGHGDSICIADSNFPSDSIASNCVIKQPIRVSGLTSEVLKDILVLLPLDQYIEKPVKVMDRVPNDKEKGLIVPAYELLSKAAGYQSLDKLDYIERFQFYEDAKKCFAIIQTDDSSLYANTIVFKGVL
jgi:L-fucose mutarotase